MPQQARGHGRDRRVLKSESNSGEVPLVVNAVKYLCKRIRRGEHGRSHELCGSVSAVDELQKAI